MRGARAKAYKKLMQQYNLNFGFRTPYQTLVDAEIIRTADAFKMDLNAMLERVLGDNVKVLITQCCIRSFYDEFKRTGNGDIQFLIDKAKMFERRRCNHSIEEAALTPKECIASVVGATNKHRYVVCSQDLELRQELRGIKGVPLVYINRSVMILEPMADVSTSTRNKQEGQKFREGLRKGESGKRKREDDEGKEEGEVKKVKKAYSKGAKGPNPLSVKKAKKVVEKKPIVLKKDKVSNSTISSNQETAEEAVEIGTKRKRRRKHKGNAETTNTEALSQVEARDDGGGESV